MNGIQVLEIQLQRAIWEIQIDIWDTLQYSMSQITLYCVFLKQDSTKILFALAQALTTLVVTAMGE